MSELLNFRNGITLYLLNKLTNDFDRIFCEANQGSIKFICANNQSDLLIGFYPPVVTHHFFELDTKDKWNYCYVFDSKEVKRNILWFKNKSNSNKKQNLAFEFSDKKIEINNNLVNAKLETIIQDPSIPGIQKMENGVSARIKNIKDMISQILSIGEEVIQVALTESELIMSGAQHSHPAYTVKVYDTKLNDNSMKYTTLCYKGILEISCKLVYAASILSPELRFYPGGATQIYGRENEILFHSLLVAVK